MLAIFGSRAWGKRQLASSTLVRVALMTATFGCAPRAAPIASHPGAVKQANLTPAQAARARSFAAHAPARTRLLASVKLDPLRVAREVDALAGLFSNCELSGARLLDRIDVALAEPSELRVDLSGPLSLSAVRCVIQRLEEHETFGRLKLEAAPLPDGVRIATHDALTDGPGAPPVLARRFEELAARAESFAVSDLAPGGPCELSAATDGTAKFLVALHSTGEASSAASWLNATLKAEPPGLAGMHVTAEGNALIVAAQNLPADAAVRLREDVVEAFRLPSGSMLPTLLPGDQLFVTKGAAAKTAERGELVAFASPREPSQVFIKRVIGVGGDRVQLDRYRVSINGAALPTTLDTPAYVAPSPDTISGQLWQETLGNHRYRVLRDESHPSEDALDVTVAPGSVFLLGDNRDNSYDSRQFGDVPLQAVKGRVALVWASFTDAEVRWQRFGLEPD